jgi:hypothetical protein
LAWGLRRGRGLIIKLKGENCEEQAAEQASRQSSAFRQTKMTHRFLLKFRYYGLVFLAIPNYESLGWEKSGASRSTSQFSTRKNRRKLRRWKIIAAWCGYSTQVGPRGSEEVGTAAIPR